MMLSLPPSGKLDAPSMGNAYSALVKLSAPRATTVEARVVPSFKGFSLDSFCLLFSLASPQSWALLGQFRYIENPRCFVPLLDSIPLVAHIKSKGRQTRSFCLLKTLTGLTESAHQF
jgi:hypothetical protein